MSCYKWELDAILEGLQLKNVDDREKLAELASFVRYTIHAKKMDPKKLFNKSKEIKRIKSSNNHENIELKDKVGFAEKVKKANEHFKNKFSKEE